MEQDMGFCASSNSVRCRPSVSLSFPSSPYIVNIPQAYQVSWKAASQTMYASHQTVRHDRGENTGTWGFCLAVLFLLIALSVSSDSEGLAQPMLSAVQTGNESPAVGGYTCHTRAEQLWPSPMVECKAGSVKGWVQAEHCFFWKLWMVKEREGQMKV